MTRKKLKYQIKNKQLFQHIFLNFIPKNTIVEFKKINQFSKFYSFPLSSIQVTEKKDSQIWDIYDKIPNQINMKPILAQKNL